MSDATSGQSQPRQDVTLLLEAALALHEKGHLDRAERSFRDILAVAPHHFIATHQLGVIQSQNGDHRSAAETFAIALQENPRSALAHMNLGIALWNLQRFEEAVDHYHSALIISPRHADTHLNLGIALRSLHRPEDALASFDQALRFQPDLLKAWLNRGQLLQDRRRFGEALESFERALALQPRDAQILTCRGAVLLDLHRPAEALAVLEHVLDLQLDHPDALLNRGVALLDLDRPTEALASIERSLALKPDQADAHMNRGNALRHLRRLSEALVEYDRALALQPDHADALLNRAMALHLLGRHEEAMAGCDRVLALEPGRSAAHSAKIFMLDFLPDLTFERHQEERRSYFEAHIRGLPLASQDYGNSRDPDRPLVLGYVSADFKRHSAASCFGPVLEHHDRSGFRIVCYSGGAAEDDRTGKFRELAHRWVRTGELSDDEMAACIRADGIDILIDLSGHSMGNRLPVFGRKPAPIQVTAWGHGGGTGLPMIDYQFTDPIHIPGWARPLFAESSLDLPCCITFESPVQSPDVVDLPARSNGVVTFGSLNRYSKITPKILELWARILASLPGSRLLLKDGVFDDPSVRSRIWDRFTGFGISPERIAIRGYTTHLEHLAAYNGVDIALDTFPQNGGITTWESLWMGVPVVAMLGDHPACRLSAAILGALGLEAWVTRNDDDYLARAVEHAKRLEDLHRLRHGLRRRILESPAGNPERYTREVEASYRAIWREWTCR